MWGRSFLKMGARFCRRPVEGLSKKIWAKTVPGAQGPEVAAWRSYFTSLCFSLLLLLLFTSLHCSLLLFASLQSLLLFTIYFSLLLSTLHSLLHFLLLFTSPHFCLLLFIALYFSSIFTSLYSLLLFTFHYLLLFTSLYSLHFTLFFSFLLLIQLFGHWLGSMWRAWKFAFCLRHSSKSSSLETGPPH